MKKLVLISFLFASACTANKSLSTKRINLLNQSQSLSKIYFIYAQRTGEPYKDYILFSGGYSSAAAAFIPISYKIVDSLFNSYGSYNKYIDQRFIIDTTTWAGPAYAAKRRPRTPQWITSEWIHKTALNIQKSKMYQLDSVLERTGYASAEKQDLIFFVFHDVRNPTRGMWAAGNSGSTGYDAVKARSYVFGVLNKQVVYYKDHFYKAGDIRKLDSAQVAKITYSLFEDFFNTQKK